MAIAVMALGIPIAAYAQSNQQDWKQSPTGLNVTAGDNAGELNLTWDPHTQTSKTLSDYRVTWTPDGEAFKTNDQTEWYAYPTTNEVTVTGLEAGATYKVRVRARYDDGRKSNWSDVVSGQSGVTPNSPATGQPTISGTAEVGDTLTAGTSAIADDNGLTNAVFSHQWVRSTAGSHTDIPGATNASYVITPADAESKIKVRVSFTDDDGYLETLTSAATASVPEPESDVVPGQSGVTPNSPATGQPTISGTTEVGDTLTAGTSAIADDNGLTNAVFSHQWVRSTAGSHTDIPGATNASYVITPADAESKIKVRVSFTDDDGYLETLTSAATASVPEPEGEQPQRDKGDGYDQNATPRSGHPAAASPCPAVNDWCTTMMVADAEGDGLLHGYEFDKFGSIVDDTIQPGGANINVWTVHTFAHPHPQLPDYIFFGSNPRVPRGTQVTIEGHTFIADAESHDGEEGDTGDKWEFPSGELPASLIWSDGQEVTISVKFPSPCDNVANTIVVKNLLGEITQPGESQFHNIKLDPFKSYLIEAIGVDGRDMLGVTEHSNLTLEDPDIPAFWNASGKSRVDIFSPYHDDGHGKNVIKRTTKTDYRTYKVEVAAGDNGTGTYQFKVRLNNVCRVNDDGEVDYHRVGGPNGYPNFDLPAGTGGRHVLYIGTEYSDYVSRTELHHVLGDNWDSDPDEDWFGVDLQQGEEYTVRLMTQTSLPERLQATELKILGIHDADGNAISGTASAGAAGKEVFVTNWEAPSTGRHYIAVGTEGTDRTGIYWISITRKDSN